MVRQAHHERLNLKLSCLKLIVESYKLKNIAYKNDYNYYYNDKTTHSAEITAMDTINYSTFRSNLASVLDKVNDDHVPVLVTRQNGKPAVILSLEDYKSFEETAYLMASPINAQRLNQAIAEVEAGQVIHHEMLEE
jgi:antitoxin YefM